MKLRILIAGCASGDRAYFESMVRQIFRARPEEESWNVSLVRLSDEWSVTLDGPEPEFKGLTFSAPDEDLQGAIRRAIKGGGGRNAHAARAAVTTPGAETVVSHEQAPMRPSSARPAAAPSPRPRATAPTRPSAPASSAPPVSTTSANGTSAPAAAASPPLAPGERRDRHQCEKCGRPFAVVYVIQPNEPKESAPVACPHCWCIKKVPIAEAAAYTNDYRAEAL